MNMSAAPRNGTRILLKYMLYTLVWDRNGYPQLGTKKRVGEKWEECFWREAEGGSPAHWEPWEGSYRMHTTHHIPDQDAIEWRPLP